MSDVAIFVSDSSHLASLCAYASINIDRTPGPDVRTGVHVGTGTPLMSAVRPPPVRVACAAPSQLACGPTCVVDICTPDARPEAEALDDMLDAAAPPEAREAGMPLEAHKAITPPADVLGAREPREDPSKRACTEDVELKMAGFRRFTDARSVASVSMCCTAAIASPPPPTLDDALPTARIHDDGRSVPAHANASLHKRSCAGCAAFGVLQCRAAPPTLCHSAPCAPPRPPAPPSVRSARIQPRTQTQAAIATARACVALARYGASGAVSREVEWGVGRRVFAGRAAGVRVGRLRSNATTPTPRSVTTTKLKPHTFCGRESAPRAACAAPRAYPACVRIRPEDGSQGSQGHWTGDAGCFTAAQATHQEARPAPPCAQPANRGFIVQSFHDGARELRCAEPSSVAWKFPPRQPQHREGGTCAQRLLSAQLRAAMFAPAFAHRAVSEPLWALSGGSITVLDPRMELA
ncbi:hypothetical protein B0H10DRAFT_2434461 [Mycena sp. CBHHK59/15]|nr:hypothetical protein B0H10DRAFT_2434461 [Mycena sp. CBHHK59/15]